MIHYGISEEATAEFDDSALKSDLSALKSDLSALKSDLTAEKLKVSTNKTNVSLNKAAITAEKTKLGNTRTLLSNLSGQVTTVENTASSNTTKIATEKARITANANKITALESKAETNRLGILNTFSSVVNYHLYIPDLSNSYRTMENVPSSHWPAHVFQFGTIDTRTTFRLVGIATDEDVVIPSANFSVSFLMRGYTAGGGSSDAVLWTLNLSDFQISGKPWFCINRDVTLRSKFPTQTLKCGQLYVKHNHGAQNISVEMIVTVCSRAILNTHVCSRAILNRRSAKLSVK